MEGSHYKWMRHYHRCIAEYCHFSPRNFLLKPDVAFKHLFNSSSFSCELASAAKSNSSFSSFILDSVSITTLSLPDTCQMSVVNCPNCEIGMHFSDLYLKAVVYDQCRWWTFVFPAYVSLPITWPTGLWRKHFDLVKLSFFGKEKLSQSLSPRCYNVALTLWSDASVSSANLASILGCASSRLSQALLWCLNIY